MRPCDSCRTEESNDEIWVAKQKNWTQYKRMNEKKENGSEKLEFERSKRKRKMLLQEDCQATWLLCDLRGRRLGSRNQRADSCGFSDLWAYKYPVCGLICSSSIHRLLPTEKGQKKKVST